MSVLVSNESVPFDKNQPQSTDCILIVEVYQYFTQQPDISRYWSVKSLYFNEHLGENVWRGCFTSEGSVTADGVVGEPCLTGGSMRITFRKQRNHNSSTREVYWRSAKSRHGEQNNHCLKCRNFFKKFFFQKKTQISKFPTLWTKILKTIHFK